MTTYLVRLKPDAEPPPDRSVTTGLWHILDPLHWPETRLAVMGAPTVCGKELMVVAGIGAEPPTRRAVLWMTHTVETDARLCAGCFGPNPVARWSPALSEAVPA